MYYVGIDIGSSAAKVCIMQGDNIVKSILMPTGYSSKETVEIIKSSLEELGLVLEGDDKNAILVATGYGRIAVDYADEVKTEISCHGKGAYYLFEGDGTLIDIGGQDTKIISLKRGRVMKFIMNDKCSAGTGKFTEIMANRLGVKHQDLERLAQKGEATKISSMCTVFAESEVVSLIAEGKSREDIAHGVIDSVIEKVVQLAGQIKCDHYYLTGGFCENKYFIEKLSQALEAPVISDVRGRFAGAIGAAIIASELDEED